MTALSSERNLPPHIIALHIGISEVFQSTIDSSAKSVGRRLSFGLETSKFVVAQGKKNIFRGAYVSVVG